MKKGGQNSNKNQNSAKFIAENIIENALNLHATDTHIEPREDKAIVRLRIHGLLQNFTELPLNTLPDLVKYFKKIANLNQNEENFPQIATIKHGEARIRISTTPMFLGEKITLRLMRARSSVRKINQIGLWGDNLIKVKKALRQPNGVIITLGDGKNTTNFALLNELNSDEKNIVTVEKTIEKTIPGMNQTAIKPKIGLNYVTGLKSALSQNPDIILVDNVSNKQTAELVFDAALNGKLLIISLPVHKTSEAIPFLIHLGVKPFLISNSLKSIITQNLVRTLPKNCLNYTKISKDESDFILKEFKTSAEKIHSLEKSFVKNENLHTTSHAIIAAPTKKSSAVFTGSTGIFEVLNLIDGELSNEFKKLIMFNPSPSEIEELLDEYSFTNLRADGLVKSLQGQTTIKEIMRRTGL